MTDFAVRARIKGTAIYVEPVRSARADAQGSPYTTTGTGARSTRWRPSALGPNAALDYSAQALRNQSRDMVRKNPLAASALERIVANAIGTGIKPQTSDKAVTDLWNRWVDEAAADGVLDFYGLEAQIMRAVVEAGEVFCRKRIRRLADGLSVPLQLELLESEFVPMDKNEPETGTRGEIRQGIEFDKNIRSKRVAYWMYSKHPGDGSPGMNDAEAHRVPADEVLHVFWPGRPGQIRGEPWMARVLARLKDLEAYDAAELVRKKTAAMMVGFIRRALPEGMSEEELAKYWGDDAEITEGVGNVSLEPGTMQILEPGEEVEFSDPKDVGGQYEVFMRMQMRAIAASLGILYEQLSGDYSQVNDRTWRAAVNEFRRRCEMWQHHLIVFQFCRPVWSQWLALARLSGALTTDGRRRGNDPEPAVKWTPPAWPYINPVQDIQAEQMAMLAGIKSRSGVVSERGEDAATIDAEQAEDNKRADTLGLKYDSDGRQANKPPVVAKPGADPAKDPAAPNKGAGK